jgi:tripartite-type tricarboxylate transporter receptor subunit TctC
MPQGIQNVIAGRVQLVVLAIPSPQPHIQSGALKALAISTAYRAPGFESIAPVADVFPGFDLGGWMALVAPAGTFWAIVQRMNAEFDTVLKEPR